MIREPADPAGRHARRLRHAPAPGGARHDPKRPI